MRNGNQQPPPYPGIINISQIIYYLLVISTFGGLAIGLVYYRFYGVDATSISLAWLTAICLVLLGIYNLGYHQLASFFLYLVISGVLTFNISIGDAIFDEAMLGYPLIIVFTGLLFGKMTVVLVTAISAAQLTLVYLLAQRGIIRPFNGLIAVDLEQTITSILILVATGMLLWVVVDIIERTLIKLVQAEREMENTYDLTLEAWAQALELRGREPSGHSRRVTALSVRFANWLGYDRTKTRHIRRGALLHDIGKMGVPEEILLKPGPLTGEEWQIVSEHPRLAAEIFKDVPYLQEALEIVRWHHERPDGQGYPYKLRGDEIPDAAKLFAIVDNWDILRTDRPAGNAWGDAETFAYLKAEAGTKFDPEMIEGFLSMLSGHRRKGRLR